MSDKPFLNRWSQRVRVFNIMSETMYPSAPLYKCSFYDMDTSDFMLMFGTGLHDKNGAEIYEGDVVNLWWEELVFEGDVQAEVEWWKDDACFGIMFIDKGVGRSLCNIDTEFHQFEVIGNIHENPKLAEKGE